MLPAVSREKNFIEITLARTVVNPIKEREPGIELPFAPFPTTTPSRDLVDRLLEAYNNRVAWRVAMERA